MKQNQDIIRVETDGQGLYDITHAVQRWVLGEAVDVGLLTVYCRHTSASLTVQENADPDVLRDLLTFFKRIAAEDAQRYRHTAEGPDDMPARIRAALTLASVSIPVSSGRMTLGTWQGLYLFEHRDTPHTRSLMLHLIGE
ncbi:MAG: secondary thiamine-phosphate synthase enzyme YjbQ [Rhodospirillales bacterium]|jgi:secondary thiamine-phosphate synthase enzyme|nr:secondary thiamine-phosphate synthase enzyme YjbQ [Rhodospirillales bacterium]